MMLLRLVIVLTVFLVPAYGTSASKTSDYTGTSRPNVVFILADDLGWDDIGFHGSTQIPTPNIDTLAYDGIILNNYYAQPICTPSRSALMTGKHPIHLGLQRSVITVAAPYGLGLEEKIMPQYFKEMGYDTHIVGKWHLGMYTFDHMPTYRGFDSHFGYLQGKEDYFDHTNGHSAKKPGSWGLDFWYNSSIVQDCYGKYSTEIFTRRTEEIIANHDQSKPLFLYLPYQAVHSGNPVTPLEAPWKYVKNFDHIKDDMRRNFAGMVSALDDSIGNITKALAAKNMLNNTIIAFSTDNGGPAAGFDMNMACNWPLRGVKASLWEGGTRGVGFVWSPLLQKSGYVSEHNMQIFDWLPTLLHASGYDMSNLPQTVDGIDMWEVLSSHDTHQRRTEMLYNIDPIERYALKVLDWKIIVGHQDLSGWYKPGEKRFYSNGTLLPENLQNIPQNISEIRSQKAAEWMYKSDLKNILSKLGRPLRSHKSVQVECGVKPANASSNCDVTKSPCLYHLKNDPCEYHNVADQHPDILQILIDRATEYAKDIVPPKNKKPDPAGYPEYHKGFWVPWINTAGHSLSFANACS